MLKVQFACPNQRLNIPFCIHLYVCEDIFYLKLVVSYGMLTLNSNALSPASSTLRLKLPSGRIVLRIELKSIQIHY